MAFFKKKVEDEWDLLPDDYEVYDDYYEIEEIIEEKPKKKQKKSKSSRKNSKKTQQKRIEDEYDDYELLEEPIDYLEKGKKRVYEKEEEPLDKKRMIIKIVISLIFAISCLGVIGYYNTDFDESGKAYTIPLSLHYKRKYAQTSDDVLDYINEINDSLKDNISELPINYLLVSDKLSQQATTLKVKTNELSRYTNIPNDFKSYHSSLLNFSLLTQDYLNELISNYASDTYNEFAYNGMIDFRNYLGEMNSLRIQMESVLFSNQEGYTSEYKSKKEIQSKKSNEEADKNGRLEKKSKNSFFNNKVSESEEK